MLGPGEFTQEKLHCPVFNLYLCTAIALIYPSWSLRAAIQGQWRQILSVKQQNLFKQPASMGADQGLQQLPKAPFTSTEREREKKAVPNS